MYRAAATDLVFNFFDPLALHVAQVTFARGIPASHEMKYRVMERMFFYIPLEHSESLQMQEECLNAVKNMADDVRGLKENSVLEAELRHHNDDLKFLSEHVDEALNVVKGFVGYVVKHRDIIKRFGRFPHRNPILGRQHTLEEERYLEEGGETFSGKNLNKGAFS